MLVIEHLNYVEVYQRLIGVFKLGDKFSSNILTNRCINDVTYMSSICVILSIFYNLYLHMLNINYRLKLQRIF